jgi:hypothetical protein
LANVNTVSSHSTCTLRRFLFFFFKLISNSNLISNYFKLLFNNLNNCAACDGSSEEEEEETIRVKVGSRRSAVAAVLMAAITVGKLEYKKKIHHSDGRVFTETDLANHQPHPVKEKGKKIPPSYNLPLHHTVQRKAEQNRSG